MANVHTHTHISNVFQTFSPIRISMGNNLPKDINTSEDSKPNTRLSPNRAIILNTRNPKKNRITSSLSIRLFHIEFIHYNRFNMSNSYSYSNKGTLQLAQISPLQREHSHQLGFMSFLYINMAEQSLKGQ